MRFVIQEMTAILLCYCLMSSIIVWPSNVFASSVSTQEQEQIYLNPTAYNLSTKFPQNKESRLIQAEYLETQYLQSEYLEKDHLQTEYSPSEYLQTELLESEYLKKEHIKIVYYEMEFISLDENFPSWAKENLRSVYGDAFDWQKFLIDVGIAGGCILIYAGLSVAGGPVGAFFAVVLTNGLTASSAVIWAGMEASIAAYKAYKEGGDLSYIAGHALNGMAEGVKWWAVWAPINALAEGLSGIKAVEEMKKIQSFQKMSDREILKLLEECPDIWRIGTKIDADSTFQVHKVYTQWAKANKQASETISEDMFKQVLKQKNEIFQVIEKTNLPRVQAKLDRLKSEQEQNQFLEKVGFSGNSGWEFIKKIQRGEITDLSKLPTEQIKNIQKHLDEFIELFGSRLNKQLLENILKIVFDDIDKDLFTFVHRNIGDKQLLTKIFDRFGAEKGHQFVNKIPRKGTVISTMKLRYGPYNMIGFDNQLGVYKSLGGWVDVVSERVEIFKGLQIGKYNTVEDVLKVTNRLKKNPNWSEIANALQRAGWHKSYPLVNDFIKQRIIRIIGNSMAKEAAEDIVEKGFSKSQIITKYGKDVYQQLLQRENFSAIAGILPKNQKLINDITTDVLKQAGIEENAVSNIMQGRSVASWGIGQEQQEKIAGSILDYYKTKGFSAEKYSQLEREIGEIRAKEVKRILNNCVSKVQRQNSHFAGKIMNPNDIHRAGFILARYGAIIMNTAGFPVFDRLAIERVEFSNLTGINSVDFARANELVFGTKDGVAGYTWHHLENGREMVLIPTDLHESYRHTGGASIISKGCLLGIR
ncbi:HNH endonuclease [Candidatus Avelusimicrobium fimicolum]|uniref:HNH endonuclease signature motif containing protein n=1 Tax=Candidatus Avelusimicrobium fimicolum TaxID=3416216 RepID=UPI003D0DA6B3